LNPGPPPCEGGAHGCSNVKAEAENSWKLTTHVPALPQPTVDNRLLEGFRDWLVRNVSTDTAEYYVNVVMRGPWPPSKHKHIKAWRKYVQYLFTVARITWEERERYLLYLRLPSQGKVVTKAVPIATIKQYKEIMEENGLGTLYMLLLGGSRLKHILLMAETWNPAEMVKHPSGEFAPRLYCGKGWCRYYLGHREGTKSVDYVYFPRPGGEKLTIPKTEYHKLVDYLRHRGVQAKLFRKFANQALDTLAHTNNIRLDAVNLIMSRELTVTGAHYASTRDWADKLFSIYVQWLRRNQLI
jgi:intergrase/recombinase